MKIEFLASESMGIRSMATFVETSDVSILIDPGVALVPIRGGYPPHKLEIEKLEDHWNRIKRASTKSRIMIVTHYHYDHLNPQEPEIFKSKGVFLKNPERFINFNQRRRASEFVKLIKDIVIFLKFADGEKYKIGKTKIRFSEPLFHGYNNRSGYVLSLSIDDGMEKFLFTSDIEGSVTKKQLNFILENAPNFLYLDGPATYMLDRGYPSEAYESSIKNLLRIIEKGFLKYLVIDHHLLREIGWRERINSLFNEASKNRVKILTAAEFMGEKLLLYEARRKELYCDSEGRTL